MHTLLEQISKELTQARLHSYWQDFKSTAFALYDEKDVYLFHHPKCNGQTYIKVPKDDQFHACTLILFEDYPTAIVDVTLYSSFEDIYSLLVHELFHGYQYLYGESRFPDELVGISYPIDAQNIQLRIRERQVLCETVFVKDIRSQQQFINEFVALRDTRFANHPEYVDYEAAIESVEGPAHYVEYRALQDIQQHKQDERLSFSKMLLDKEESHTNIRRSCYSSGVFLCLVLDNLSKDWQQAFVESQLSLYDFLKELLPTYEKVTPNISNNNEEIADIVQKVTAQRRHVFEAFQKNKGIKLVIQGALKVVGFDPMNIVILDSEAIHRNFLKVQIGNTVHFINQPIYTTFNESFKQPETLQLYLDTTPIQIKNGLHIDGLGTLHGMVNVTNNVFHIDVSSNS